MCIHIYIPKYNLLYGIIIPLHVKMSPCVQPQPFVGKADVCTHVNKTFIRIALATRYNALHRSV